MKNMSLVFNEYQGNLVDTLNKIKSARPTQIFATPSQIIDERIKQGAKWKDSPVCTKQGWANASMNEVYGDLFVTKEQFNPLTLYPEIAVNSTQGFDRTDHPQTGKQFWLENILLGDEPLIRIFYKIEQEDRNKPIEKRRVMKLGERENYEVATSCLGDDKFLSFFAGGQERAQQYGLFLRNYVGVQELSVLMPYSLDKTRSTGIWFFGLDDGNNWILPCNCDHLHCDTGTLFGVHED